LQKMGVRHVKKNFLINEISVLTAKVLYERNKNIQLTKCET
jgi:hypothetical protein